jgi:hypothetical protein
MNTEFLKVVVGLALEIEISNKRFNQQLFDLYSNPCLSAIKAFHDELIDSNNHFDREVAFWLALALQESSIKINLQDMLKEMREMEILLSDLLSRVSADAQKNMNLWLNYLINVPQCIQEGYWVDAKVLMSLAVQSSTSESIEKLKSRLDLGYTVGVLQKETIRLFREIKKFPLKLVIPKRNLRVLLEVQGVLIELLGKYYLETPRNGFTWLILNSIHKLKSTQRYLMSSESKFSEIKHEIKLTADTFKGRAKCMTDKDIEWSDNLRKRIKKIIGFLE